MDAIFNVVAPTVVGAAETQEAPVNYEIRKPGQQWQDRGSFCTIA
ncbi:uncharacterized protein PFL1_06827 [Pseudozyma flocculosa PF-1]|uniref:Uncharacterized protein n=1 Tax=Pseudozyma flocculosa TaxID=84751 RepID=A0A5C3EX73_9BASI|nr:uncharacterized protein PFL1_06827 [Pseudozyma flocculosa PF-1]EPQ30812.1 hypothetical protein PFL1_06827 [Pseudozyma flocculosa PF-1]SPO36824.1 uncharacterized protein PSFLO_02295 [Pseudozyma flocculosa]